jgi:poly-gamma-glutamate capsule biosynthesis protein CapA/YwtB (metallophosphatase superfamily)
MGIQDSNIVTLMAVGDIRTTRDNPESLFEKVVGTFREADILFGNCEVPFSDRGSPNPISPVSARAKAQNVSALKYAGFHVMPFANNHSLDWGYDAFLDTIDLLRQNGIVPIGAGRNLAEARQPAVLERKGMRIAFLAYAFVTHAGYEAKQRTPGTAVLKAYTYYHHAEEGQPGTPPKIFTFVDPDDLQSMREDIQAAKRQADVLVVSFHWGLHFAPALIAMYEREVSRVAIDNGADLILGHHQHILKGINTYRGKVVFHGLANFALDAPFTPDHLQSEQFRFMQSQYPGLLGPKPEDPAWYYPPNSRKTVIVKATIGDGRILKVSYIPCVITVSRQPVRVAGNSPEFDEGLTYMREISTSQGLNVELVPEGSEIVVLDPSVQI